MSCNLSPISFLSKYSQSLKDSADRSVTLPRGDVFPDGMANQHLPLKNPLPQNMTLDFTTLWDTIDEGLAYW